MIEEWRDIEEYEGYYQISNKGRVKSLARSMIMKDGRGKTLKERILKLSYDQDGYVLYGLSKYNKVKTYKAHRLVASYFIPNPDNLPMVNHKNGIKHDNRVENLEWCDAFYNSQHAIDVLKKK